MSIEVTEQAQAVLRRSMELAKVQSESGGIRLRAAKGLGGGADVQIELAEGPAPEEEIVELEGLRLFVDPSVMSLYPDALVTVEPQHETVVVRPAEAP